MTSARVLFVDLDGTLTLENTFHVFIRAIGRHTGRRGVRLLGQFVLRRFLSRRRGGGLDRRIASKATLVQGFSRLPTALQQAVVDETVSLAMDAISPAVSEVIQEWRSAGAVIVLATAAPECYAREIARRAGLDDTICSRVDDAAWVENVGATKAAACERWLQQQSPALSHVVGVVTDHTDDVPLLRMAAQSYIQASEPTAVSIARLAGFDEGTWTVLDLTAPQPNGGWWFFVKGGLRGPIEDSEAYILLSKHRNCLVLTNRGWIVADGGYGSITPLRRIDRPFFPSVTQRSKMEVRTWLRRRILLMTH